MKKEEIDELVTQFARSLPNLAQEMRPACRSEVDSTGLRTLGFDVEDLWQEVSVRLLNLITRRPADFEKLVKSEHFSAYVRKMIHNEARSALRKLAKLPHNTKEQSTVEFVPVELVPSTDLPLLEQLERTEQLQLLNRLRATLSEEERRMLDLKYVEGLTVEQIAKRLYVPPARREGARTIRATLLKITRYVRDMMEELMR